MLLKILICIYLLHLRLYVDSGIFQAMSNDVLVINDIDFYALCVREVGKEGVRK